MHITRSNKPKLMLLPLLLGLTACSSKPPELPADPVAPPAIPALPLEARQPTPQPYCLPTCSSALMRERESWQQQLTAPE